MIRNLLALVLCGLSLGWLMGMSVSPVVKDVLTALLAVVTTLLMALAGLSGNKQAENDNALIRRLNSFDALPVGVFLAFLALGSAGGVFVRTNDLLGPNPTTMAWRWALAADDPLRLQLRKILLDQRFTKTNATATAQTNTLPSDKGGLATTAGKNTIPPEERSVLYASVGDATSFCESIKTANGDELRIKMLKHVARIQQQLTNPSSADSLTKIKVRLCPTCPN